MQTPAERIERIVTGVVKQALHDAGASVATVQGSAADATLLRTWCTRAFGQDAVGSGGLDLHPINKTALLLGENPRAAVLPFGDLYYSDVVELAGAVPLADPVQEIAAACHGAGHLDDALRKYFDERMSWEQATLHLDPPARERLQRRLEAARFHRARLGLIPKLGARTLGIDLYA